MMIHHRVGCCKISSVSIQKHGLNEVCIRMNFVAVIVTNPGGDVKAYQTYHNTNIMRQKSRIDCFFVDVPFLNRTDFSL